MRLSTNRGFTLIEVIVVAGIIAILAGILVPLIFKEIDESRISRAAADVRSISSALIVYKKDTGQWPVSATCTSGVTIIQGLGTIPAAGGGVVGWDTSNSGNFNDYLMTDDNGCWPDTWKGPYMASVNRDPWGNAYILNADQLSATNSPVWILSAGPNGIIDNSADATALNLDTDDVGLRLK